MQTILEVLFVSFAAYGFVSFLLDMVDLGHEIDDRKEG